VNSSLIIAIINNNYKEINKMIPKYIKINIFLNLFNTLFKYDKYKWFF